MGAPVACGTLAGSTSVPGPASINKPLAATSRASVDTLGSYDSHNPFDRRGVGCRRRARFPQPREAADGGRRHRRCEIRPSGRRDAASPRSSVGGRRFYGAHKSAIAGGHGHAVGATVQTWRSASQPRRSHASRAIASCRRVLAGPQAVASVLTDADSAHSETVGVGQKCLCDTERRARPDVATMARRAGAPRLKRSHRRGCRVGVEGHSGRDSRTT